MKLSIVIPCYNEAKNIPLILSRINDIIKNEDIEVILVNNGSTDNTANVLHEYLPKYSFAKTVLVPVNQGYGYGIKQGLKKALGDYVGWTHADMQTDPKDIFVAYDILKEHNDITNIYVKGNRKNRPFVDKFFELGMSIFEKMLLKLNIYDINAQPNIFSKNLLNYFDKAPNDFSLDLYAYAIALKLGYKFYRYPVQFVDRIYGKSHWNNGTIKSKFLHILSIMKYSFELKKLLYKML